jgi:ribosomal protein S18 acetylase RimI-like enzyme
MRFCAERLTQALTTRPLAESDYEPVIAVLDKWWGGRPMAGLLPRLFFQHFGDTSFAVENEEGRVAAFLVGFRSQSHPDEAYIHFVGVDPAYRGHGIGAALYRGFFERVLAQGVTRVHAVTSPVNRGSVAFHQAMGFDVEPGDDVVDDIPVQTNYDGVGGSRVRFVKTL